MSDYCSFHKPRKYGYIKYHKWAQWMHKRGIDQVQCPDCKRFLFPCEWGSRAKLNKARAGLPDQKPRITINNYGETVDRSRKCLTCGGSGEVHSHNKTCWDCHGTGYLTKAGKDEKK